MNTKLSVLLVSSALITMGCDQKQPAAAQPVAAPAQTATAPAPARVGNVAVFDIDYVADQTGMVQGLKKKMEARRDDLKKQLEKFSQKLKGQLQAEGAKIKKDKDTNRKIAMLEQATQMRYRQAQAEAEAALNTYRVGLIAEIRDAIRPVAREVAYANGFDVILLRNETVVFALKDEVELTNEILAAYQSKFPDAVKRPEPAPEADKKADKPEAKKPAGKK